MMENEVEKIERNIEHAIAGLRVWARHMAARYNGPVYLGGSTIHNPTPRDCDVFIVVADIEFAARYHLELHLEDLREHHPVRKRRGITRGRHIRWSEEGANQGWIDDIAKFSGHLSVQLQLNNGCEGCAGFLVAS